MSVGSPLRLGLRSASGLRPGPRLRLPQVLVGPQVVAPPASLRNEEAVVRSVAAAAAIADPEGAMKRAKLAEEEPEKALVFKPPKGDEAKRKLQGLLRQVGQVTARKEPLSAEQVAVARAVGADPILVGEALEKIQEDKLASSALDWATSVDARSVEIAGREAARARSLGLISDPVTAFEQLNASVDSVSDRVASLGKELGSTKTELQKNLDALRGELSELRKLVSAGSKTKGT